MTGSARPERRNPPPPSRRKTGKTLPVLLSCCLFLAIACGCLLAALVLVGKHFVYNAIAISHRSDLEIKVKRPLARLSNDTEPIHYDLTLMPDLETGRFQGKVNITIILKNTKENITLHSKNLHIETVELKFREHPALLAVQNIEENIVDETLTVVPKEKLFAGTYFLYFEFSGSLVKKLTGLYRSQYRRRDTNETRAMATSKFEPTYARQAFPCFDEPNKKAKYTVHLVKPKDPTYQALSNMPVASEETTPNGDILVHFEPSVKMSTYLTCFIVSDFKYTEDKIAPNVPFRVFATPEQIEKTNYAREVGKKVMEYYTKYFGIPYPLPKLDMAAIPDFVSGAMEHWGLVTYRETALLYTNKTHSSSNKQRVATVVAHELAHSWFGNLVTMDWWNDLWLNEGFASYIQYKGTDSAEPDWQMLDQFLISTLHSILSLDSTLGSHPIVQSVLTPDEITSIFDAVSYNKGASILRMLEDAVGEKNFQQSITNYLNAHKFENAVTQDLLNEIQEIVDNDINVTEFVSTWTVQMGYPVINVKTQGKEYVLTQKQFLKDPDNEGKAPPSPYNYKWTIPITYITSENSSPQYVWFNHSNTKVTIPKPQNVKWIKFNYKQVGYYRINYEEEDWQILSENIKHLSNADKTHLLEETFSLAEAGQLSYHIALNLTKYLSSESNYIPWSVASSVFEHLKMIMSNSKYLADLKKYVVDLVTPAFNNLTWESKPDENHLTRLARVTVLDLACSMGHVQCLKDAGKQFTNYLYNNSELSQDLRGLIYSYGMSYGSQEDWDKLFQIFVAENDANEKLKMLNGLASIKDAGTLRQLIDLAKDETYIRSQDYFSCLKFISDNPIGTSIVWDYVRENWEFLVERFGLNDRYLGQLIPAITRTFSTNTKLEEMQAFFIKYPNAGAGATSRSQALETVQNNIKWLARYKESVEDWIKNSSN